MSRPIDSDHEVTRERLRCAGRETEQARLFEQRPGLAMRP